MTTADQLLELVQQALTVAPDTTIAGAKVYLPRDWPIQLNDFPVLLLQMTQEDKESLGRQGAQQFTTTLTVRITGHVAAKAAAADGGAGVAEAALWALKRQIELAVICFTPIERQIQQIAFVRSSVGIDSSGAQHVGQLRVEMGLEFYEGPENFYPPEVDDLDELRLTAPAFPDAGFIDELGADPAPNP